MRKILFNMVILVLLLVNFPAATEALSQEQVDQYRQKMADSLANTPAVTFYDLLNDPNAYVGKMVKFRAKVVGTNDPAIYLQDNDGNKFVIRASSYYKLKLNQEYEISGIFETIKYVSDGDRAALFTREGAHLPFMDEYSDFYR